MTRHVISELPDWLTGDMSTERETQVRDHLRQCESCRREWERFSHFVNQAADIDKQAEAAMKTIDWKAFAADTLEKARRLPRQVMPSPEPADPIRFPSRFSWHALLGGIAATLLIGLISISGLRVQSFHPGNRISASISSETLDHMETTLTRDHLLQYLDQSQILLTDIMKQCRTAPPDPQEIARHSRQIRTLLQKKAFIEPEFDRVELAKAEPICGQLDLLFYEIMKVPPEAHCSELERIQNLIRQENILFKIRLLESDLRFAASEA